MVKTHLVKEQVIELPGYTWYGNNRAKHKKAIRGSGGVGILCKDTLLHQFSIAVLDNNYEVLASPITAPQNLWGYVHATFHQLNPLEEINI